MRPPPCLVASLILSLAVTGTTFGQAKSDDLKVQIGGDVERMKKQTQVMIDMLFSFGELGFQEIETSTYLTGVLEKESWEYFRTVQTKSRKYQPLISPNDKPAIHLNTRIMADYRERMRTFYYDPAKYDTYLDQLGIKYPTVRQPAGAKGTD
ncbi:MAG: hypothetical protein Q7S40_13315 [Opitutaceae bacterium]|nr:hypothetical protein [Opitutaceae bacterium]